MKAKANTYPPVASLSEVPGLTFLSHTSRSMNLKWKPVIESERAVTYRIFFTPFRGTEEFIDTTIPNMSLKNLKPATLYYINIQAFNTNGFGPKLKFEKFLKTASVNECLQTNNCDKNGECLDTDKGYLCRCNRGFVGNGYKCRYIPKLTQPSQFCSASTDRNIDWRTTFNGGLAVEKCPRGTSGYATRFCEESTDGKPAAFEQPDLSGCLSDDVSDVEEELFAKQISASEVFTTLSEVIDSKRGSSGFYGGDVVRSIELCREVFDRKMPKELVASEEAGRAMVGITSQLLNSSSFTAWSDIPATERSTTSQALVNNVEVAAEKISKLLTLGRVFQTYQQNMAMKVQRDVSEKDRVSFETYGKNNVVDSSITIPPKEIIKATNNQAPVIFVKYNNLGRYLKERNTEKKKDDEIKQNKDQVVSATVYGYKINFENPVVITLTHAPRITGTLPPSCVFWNESLNKGSGDWSREGCFLNKTESTRSVCHCYHLTSFAILMSVSQAAAGGFVAGSPHLFALALISNIGLFISIVALVLCLITFVFFKFLKSTRTTFHKHLAFSLLLGNIVFLAGIDKTGNPTGCQAVAFLLHYLFLVAFVWMGMEGLLLYYMLGKIFGNKGYLNRRLIHLMVWLVPLAYVGILFGVLPGSYATSGYCWITTQNNFIWSFVGPVVAILFFNFIILIKAFRVMAEKHENDIDKPMSDAWYWMKGAFVLFCLLGVTWIVGLFYVNSGTVVFGYVFNIFNSLQGLFIFIFHCLMEKKTRDEYKRLLTCQSKSDFNEKHGYSESMKYRKLSQSATKTGTPKSSGTPADHSLSTSAKMEKVS
jgi:latrophilin 3